MRKNFNPVNPSAEDSPLGVRKSALPRKIAAVIFALIAFGLGYFFYYLTLDDGLRSLLWFKNEIQSEYYDRISDDEFWQAAIDGVENILDDYSCFYSAAEYDEVVNADRGIKVGTGLSFFSDSNKIYKVAIGSPAFYARSGLGESIEEGMYVTGVGAAAGEYTDTFDISALEKALGRFETGDTVYLRLSKDSANGTQDCVEAALETAQYTESFVLYATAEDTYAVIYSNGTGTWERIGEGMEELNGQTAYIRLTQFYGNAVAEFSKAAEQYRADGMTVLLFDLRNNGGGSMNVLSGLASYLMKGAESGDVVAYTEGRHGRDLYKISGAHYDRYFSGSKIYVAANRNSASASEALMGAMISSGTVGYEDIYLVTTDASDDAVARTYGKGIMQTTFYNFLTGEAVKLTTARVYWPDGTTCIHGRGIRSDEGAHKIYSPSNAEYGDPALSEILADIDS